MGIYASAHRLPLDAAVDWLTVRDIWVRERFGRPQHSYWEPAPDEPPRVLWMGRMNSTVLDAMTGTHHGPPTVMYVTFDADEWDDPRAWAALGARLVGWPSALSNAGLRNGEPPQQGAEERPLRYTLPQDIEAICDVLAQMTPVDMREQVEQVLAKRVSEETMRHWISLVGSQAAAHYEGTGYYEGAEKWMREEVAVNLLPNLRQFYEAARAEGEIVIHDMR